MIQRHNKIFWIFKIVGHIWYSETNNEIKKISNNNIYKLV